ncbi:MAG: DegV family EDD domain-containing protein [Rhodanobacteraceae bacterium]|nr:MAG: DegV family EDD domain-containing protein [Rhodanobacteraceae bacterium]
MRIGLVVDATCDLPRQFIDDHQIIVMPITVKIDEHTFVDVHEPAAMENYYLADISKRGHAAETASLSVDEIRDLFLGKLVLDYDAVFCLTVTSTRSPIFANATQASFAILGSYRPIRRAAGNESPFLMRVVDTRSLFAGQGVTAIEATRLVAADTGVGQIRERLVDLASHTYAYVVPRDLNYLRARTRQKGDRSVGFLTAKLGTALDIKPILRGFQGETEPVAKARGFDNGAGMLFGHAVAAVKRGLMVPAVCVSYGGPLQELEALPGHQALATACAEAGVTLYQSVMSITGMVNLGTGAVSLGYAAATDDTRF